MQRAGHAAIALMGLLLPLACGKSEVTEKAPPVASSSPPPASASAAAAAAPSAATPPPSASAAEALPLPKCPSGLMPNAFPAYCIKLPPAYGVKESRISPKRGSIQYDTGTTTDNLMVSYDDSPLAQVAKDAEGELKFGGDKLEKRGRLPGGRKWYLGSHGDYERVVSVVPARDGLTLKCSFAYQPKKAPPKEAVEACKSIVMP